MNTIIFACSTLRKELLAAMKENNNHTPIFFLPREVHTDPKFLHTYVQDKIDRFCQVDRIVICTSGCGGGTIGLTATTAEIVIPRTRDCLDILLSGNSLSTLEAERGKEGAAKFIKKLYGRINQFYIIDTGCYDLTPVRKYVRRMAHILNGTVEEIQGQYGILKKIAKNQFDEDFLILRKGDTVPHGFTFPVSTK